MSKTQAEKQRAYRARVKAHKTLEPLASGNGLARQTVTDSNGNAPNSNGNAPVTRSENVTEEQEDRVEEIRNIPANYGPLDVYSESRWAYLQGRGHIWDPNKQRGVRPDGIIGVTVPGDPAYHGAINNPILQDLPMVETTELTLTHKPVTDTSLPGEPACCEVAAGECMGCGKPTDHVLVVMCPACCTEGRASVRPRSPHVNGTFDDLPKDVQYQIDKHCAENNNGDRAGSHSRAAMTERALSYQEVVGSRPGPYPQEVAG